MTVNLYSLGVAELTHVSTYLTQPSTIVRTRQVSSIFYSIIAVEASKAFFHKYRQAVYQLGFRPVSNDAYQNFRDLFLLLNDRCGKIIKPLFSFGKQETVNPLAPSRIDHTFDLRFTINQEARTRFARAFFPTLIQSNAVARVMAIPRDGESPEQTFERLWFWLKRDKGEVAKVTQIACINPPDDMPQYLPLHTIPYEVTWFTHLKELRLDGHRLTEVPPCIGDLKFLRVLSLSRNLIQRVDCVFHQMTELKFIDLKANCLGQLPPPELFGSRALLSLEVDSGVVAYSKEDPQKYTAVFIQFDFRDFGDNEQVAKIIRQNCRIVLQAAQDDVELLPQIQELEQELDLVEGNSYVQLFGLQVNLATAMFMLLDKKPL